MREELEIHASSAPELFPPPQVTGLAGESGMLSDFVQRTAPRRLTLPRRHQLAGMPSPPR